VNGYTPKFADGTRVVFEEKDHSKSGEQCTIFDALNNPSRLPEHQWYDVRFEDNFVGRFLESRLKPVAPRE
jgi:hypothetical protein